jgi:hypothetical protein
MVKYFPWDWFSLRPAWHGHCSDSVKIDVQGRYSNMKSLGSTIAQFAAIIVIMITLAVSTAAFSMWLGDGTKLHEDGEGAQRSQAIDSR